MTYVERDLARPASSRPTTYEPWTRSADRASANGRRNDIEGLRAIAVLLVVAYHAGIRQVRGGYVGVDVFFVLSGYLITGILLRQVMEEGRVDYVQFYARRMRRLLPAATLMLLVILATGALLLGPMERVEPSLSAIATALYSSNGFFLTRAVNYFATSSETNPLLHTWSLAVEEQFYLFWPWLIVVGWKVGRTRRGLAALIALFSVVSFAGCVLLTYRRQPWAFFGTPARAWEFGLGALATLVPVATTRGARAVWHWLGWIGVAMVVATAFLLRPTTAFPGAAAMVPVLGTSLALVAGTLADERFGVGCWLGTRVLRWIGGRSYAWYLWHWPVLVFAAALWPRMPLGGRIACALGALALATVSTALLENPIRFHPRLVGRPRLSIAMGLCLTVASAGIALGAYESALAHGGRFWHAAHDRSDMAGTGCTLDATESAPRPCIFGDTTAAAAIALFGDSHAAQWFSALDSVARVRGLRLVTMTKYGCSVSRIANYDRKLKRRFDECERWREASIRQVVALRPSVLVIAQYSAQDVVRVLPVDDSDAPLASSWEEGLRSSLQTLDSAGVRTLLIGDTPAPHHLVPACLSRAQHHGRPASVCDVPRARAVDTLARRAEVEGVAGLRNVHLLDLTDHVCAATMCAATRGDTIVYLDDNHLTDAFVRGLTPTIDSAVSSVLVGRNGHYE